jgi:hypothetical protein
MCFHIFAAKLPQKIVICNFLAVFCQLLNFALFCVTLRCENKYSEDEATAAGDVDGSDDAGPWGLRQACRAQFPAS